MTKLKQKVSLSLKSPLYSNTNRFLPENLWRDTTSQLGNMLKTIEDKKLLSSARFLAVDTRYWDRPLRPKTEDHVPSKKLIKIQQDSRSVSQSTFLIVRQYPYLTPSYSRPPFNGNPGRKSLRNHASYKRRLHNVF